jgi:hypothetical protein
MQKYIDVGRQQHDANTVAGGVSGRETRVPGVF